MFVFYFARQVFALLFVAALGGARPQAARRPAAVWVADSRALPNNSCPRAAAYLQNPARGPAALRDAAWPPLLSARSAALSAAADAALQRGSVLSALSRTFLDGGVRLLRSRRVLADFAFFAVAYVDSPSDVDQALCCLGVLGAWHVLRAPWLRAFAAEHARARGAEEELNAAAAGRGR